MKLRDWLEGSHRFCWGGQGGDDCLMFCASWIAEATGADPAFDFRGTYSTEEEAKAILAAYGGVVPFVDFIMARAGFKRTHNPQNGDIGIIRAPSWLGGNVSEIGAIRFGPLWACLGPAGVVAKQVEWVAAWEVPQ